MVKRKSAFRLVHRPETRMSNIAINNVHIYALFLSARERRVCACLMAVGVDNDDDDDVVVGSIARVGFNAFGLDIIFAMTHTHSTHCSLHTEHHRDTRIIVY